MSALLMVALLLGTAVPLGIGFVLPDTAAKLVAGLSVILSGIALFAVCAVVLSGPVYFAQLTDAGKLKAWGVANKVVAVAILGGWVYLAARLIF